MAHPPSPVSPVPSPQGAEPEAHGPYGMASPLEEAFLVPSAASPGTTAYHLALGLRLPKGTDVAHIEAGLKKLWQRHEALRTSFPAHGSSFRREIAEGDAFHVFRGPSATDAGLCLFAYAPFDVERGPLFRAGLFEGGAAESGPTMVVVAHHAVCDLASLRKLLEELSRHCEAPPSGAPDAPPGDLGARALAQEMTRPVTTAALEAIRERLANDDTLPVLDVPTRAARSAWPMRNRGDQAVRVSASVMRALTQRCSELHTSVYAMLLAAWQVCLAHEQRHGDVIVGTPAAWPRGPAFGATIACAVNVIATRGRVQWGQTLREHAAHVAADARRALAMRRVPFAPLYRHLAAKGIAFTEGASPVFQSVFNHYGDAGPLGAIALGIPGGALQLGGLTGEIIGLRPAHAVAELALGTYVTGAGELAGTISFDADLYDAHVVARVAHNFEAALVGLGGSPDLALADLRQSFRPARLHVHIAANFALGELADPLAFWMDAASLPCNVTSSPGTALFQELLSNDTALARHRGPKVVFLRASELVGGDEALHAENLALLMGALRSASSASDAGFFIAVAPSERTEGAEHDLRPRLLAELASLPGTTTIDLAQAAALYQVNEVFVPESFAVGTPLSDEMLVASAAMVARALRSALVPPRKVLCLDADNTLWGGVVAEDGVGQLRVAGAHEALQHQARALRDAGMLLALVSKNEPEDVLSVFAQRSDMILRATDFVSIRAGWGPKSAALRALASELSLDVASFVFVDDNPVECAEVRAALPDVLCIQLDPGSPQAATERCWELLPVAGTREDALRAERYQTERARQQSRDGAESMEAFLGKLGLRATVRPMSPADLDRAAQMTARTNQLNTTTMRLGAGELARLPDTWVVDVTDRFGDYGTVGLVHTESGGGALRVPVFLLSCRVLGRGVESKVFAFLFDEARRTGLSRLVVPYQKTARNAPALRMLTALSNGAVEGPSGEVTIEVEDSDAGLSRLAKLSLGDGAAPPQAAEAHAPAAERAGELEFYTSTVAAQRLLSATEKLPTAAAMLRRMRERRRLRATTGDAPHQGLEQLVAATFETVLGLRGICRDDDFFALGGTSLAAVQMLSRLRTVRPQGLGEGLAMLVSASTVAGLAAALEGALEGAPTAPPSLEHRSLGASPSVPALPLQQQLYRSAQLAPEDPAYNVPVALQLPESVSLEDVQAAVTALMARHDALRGYLDHHDGTVVFRGREACPVTVSELRVEQRTLAEHLQRYLRAPFDLGAPTPLLRARLLEVEASTKGLTSERVLLVVFHHAIVDGASLAILGAELMRLLAGSPLGPAPSFFAWATGTPPRAATASEEAALLGEVRSVPPLTLPFPSVPSTPGPGACTTTLKLDSEEITTARQLANATQTSLVGVLACAFAASLAFLSGNESALVAMPVSGRDREGTGGLVGPLVQTACVPVHVPRTSSVRECLRGVHESILRAPSAANVPWERVTQVRREAWGDSEVAPVQALLSVMDVPALGAAGFALLPVAPAAAQFDVDLQVLLSAADAGCSLRLTHKESVLPVGAASVLLQAMRGMLEFLCEAPERAMAHARLLTNAERRAVLALGQGRSRAFPVDESILTAFQHRARQTPDALALIDDDERVSYGELYQRCLSIAGALLARGVRRGDRVGIDVPRSATQLACIYGVLLVGAAYVPLETDVPRVRQRFMVQDAGVSFVLTTDASVWGDQGLSAQEALSSAPASLADLPVLRGSDLLYVLYTSGSTGQPKGVLLEHRGLNNRLCWQTEALPLHSSPPQSQPDRALYKTPFGFDVSVWELFLPLRVGATLVIAREGGHRDPEYIEGLLKAHDVTIVHFVPSMLRAYLAFAAEPLPKLRRVLASGEALTSELARDLGRILPKVELHNLYGPTEASIEVTHAWVPTGADSPARVTIGKPIDNAKVYVVGSDGALLPRGCVGELWLGGPQIARGYTATEPDGQQSFRPDPFGSDGERVYCTGDRVQWTADGELAYLGRRDAQVKIRGQRIELGEVEHALRRCEGVKDAAAVVALAGTDTARLVAYVVPRESAIPSDVLDGAVSELPEAMRPKTYVFLSEIPKNAAGKLDRKRLPPLEDLRAPTSALTAGAMGSDEEQRLAEIWAALLAVPITPDTDFWRAGGDSILALKMVAQARERGLALSPRQAYEHRSLRALARAASSRAAGKRSAGPATNVATHDTVGESAPLLPMQSWFFRTQPEDAQDHYLQSLRLVAPRRLSDVSLERGLEQLGARHPALSCVFEDTGAGMKAKLGPAARVAMITVDAGTEQALVEARLSAQQRAIAEVGLTRAWLCVVHLRAAGHSELVLVAHHLVVDGISLRLLAADLERACLDLTPAPRTMSPLPWARALAGHVDAPAVGSRSQSRMAEAPPGAFSVGLEDATPGCEGDTQAATFELSTQQTTLLLGPTAERFLAGPQDLLLAALRAALAPTGGPVVLDVELHGRERAVLAGFPVDETVGWFTELRTAHLGAPEVEAWAPSDANMAVASSIDAFSAEARALPPRAVVFNFLGTTAAAPGAGSLLQAQLTEVALDRGPAAVRSHAVEILAIVHEGALRLQVRVREQNMAWARALVARFAAQLDAFGSFAPQGGTGASAQVFPLLPLQAALVVACERAQDPTLYVEQVSISPKASFDEARLRRAAQALVTRHPVLRTTIDGGFQCLGSTAVASDACTFSEATAHQDDDAFLLEQRQLVGAAATARGASSGPLFRLALRTRSDGSQILSLAYHHVILDGWCVPLLLGDLYRAYGGQLLSAETPNFRDFARGALHARPEASTAGLVAQLEAHDDRTLVPFDGAYLRRTRPADSAPTSTRRTSTRRTLTTAIPPALDAQLRARGRTLGVSHATMLLAAYVATHTLATGQPAACLDVTVSGRSPELPQSLEMVGLLTQTVPMLVPAPDEMTDAWLRDLHTQLGETQLGALALARQGVGPRHSPETLFAIENYPVDSALLAQATIAVHRRVHYPFAFVVPPGPAGAEVDYDPSRIDEADARLFLSGFARAAAALAKGPLALRSSNLWPRAAPLESSAALGGTALAARLARFGDAPDTLVAVIRDDKQTTYGELRNEAAGIAEALRSRGMAPGARVGIMDAPGPLHVAGLLAVWSAGAVAVPLDPGYPDERLQHMARVAGLSCVLAGEAFRTRAATVLGLPCVERDAHGRAWVPPTLDLRAAAYVLFTSGSTGVPKGVLCPLEGVLSLIADLDQRAHVPEHPRTAQWTSPSFDVSLWETLSTLSAGGTLIVVPDEVRPDAAALCRLLDDARVESAYVPGFALAALAEACAAGACRSLVRVLVGVEPIASQLAETLLAAAPQLTLVNGYGPTEASICATLHTVVRGARSHEVLPLGRAVAGAIVRVVDRAGARVPPRVPGRILVGGVGLALSYLGASAKDQARFAEDPETHGGRLYDTGDLAYAEADGTLVYLGRSDAQLKVRGLRIEAEETEAVLRRQTGVHDAAITAMGDGETKRLVALVVLASGGTEPEGNSARASIAEGARAVLPGPMVPAEIHVVRALPRDASGKLRRAALPGLVPGSEGALEARPEADPRTELLLQIATGLLGRRPRLDESFFAAGGNSLLAVQLLSRLRKTLGTELRLRHIFEARTLGALAAELRSGTAGASRLATAPLATAAPSFQESARASFAQERLAFIDHLRPGDPVYNLVCAAELRGELSPVRLEAALRTVVARHEALRTVFREEAGTLLQIVRPAMPPELHQQRVEGGRDEAMRLASTAARVAFDLANGPLLRAHLFAFASGAWLFCLTMHHIAADGWSLNILLGEIALAYDAPAALPPVGARPIDVSLAERALLATDVRNTLSAYWTERLRDLPDSLPFYRDRPYPKEQSFRGGHLLRRLGKTTVASVGKCATALDATPAMVYLAALDATLARMSGTTDIPVGVSLANRGTLDRESMVGFLVNVVVVRVEVTPEQTFAELLQQVRARSIEAYEHQELPFDRVATALAKGRGLGHAPLFQVNFVYEEARPMPSLRALTVTPVHVETHTARFDLAFALQPDDDGLALTVEYNEDILDAATAAHIAAMFEHAVLRAAEASHEPLARLWNDVAGPTSDASAAPASRSLFAPLFAAACKAHASRTALWQGETRLTYTELDGAVARVADVLGARGVGPGQVVLLHLPRSIASVVCILALWRLGAAYTPSDPETPVERVTQHMDDARPTLVISTEEAEGMLPASLPQALLLLAEELPLSEGSPGRAPERAPHAPMADDLAYVIYTSGSTGKPNGVCVPHRGLGNLAMAQCDTFGITHDSVVLQFASLSFDASVSEMVTALAAGATLYLGAGADRTRVADDLHACTVATLPPSLLAALDPGDYPGLRTVVSAGETLTAKVAQRWTAAGKRLVNAYGPTEATVCASMAIIADAEGLLRIGAPMPGVRITVRDEAGQVVPRGMVGELWLGGTGLASGYLRRSELTEQRFVASNQERWFRTGDRGRMTLGGELEFSGRSDGQLKIRGHRIEPEEVETALRALPMVQDAAVYLAGPAEGPMELVAEIVSSGSAEPAEVRARLRTHLPGHMIPDRVVVSGALLRNTSGKVDRTQLRARYVRSPLARMADSASDATATMTGTVAIIAVAMTEVLRGAAFGPNDNFFEMGGDSIGSIQVAALCQRRGVRFGVRDLFLHQTPKALAEVAEIAEARPGDELGAEGDVPLLPLQRWFLGLPGFNHAHYTQLLELRGPENWASDAAERAIDAVVRAHDALRLRFEPQPNGGHRQWYGPADGAIVLQVLRRDEEAYGQHCEEAALGLDLAHGPVARIVLRGPDLFLAVHHLVSDAYSLRILLSDFAAAYASARAGQPILLPSKTASFKAYATALLRESQDLDIERAVLAKVAEAGALAEEACVPGSVDLRGAAATRTFALPAVATHAVLREAPKRLACDVQAVLLAALASALADPASTRPLVVDLEGHGRLQDVRAPALDASRTVGFCTALCPVLLPRETASIEGVARNIANQLEEIPAGGAGFAGLGWCGHGDIAFNYLGDMGAAGAAILMAQVRVPKIAAQSPQMPRPQKLEFTLGVEDGCLQIDITYHPIRHSTAQVQAWGERMLQSLLRLSGTHAAAPGAETTGPVAHGPEAHGQRADIETPLGAEALSAVLDELAESDEGAEP